MSWTVRDARSYIAEVQWTYAKTMPDWPHEYSVRAWRPELDGRFAEFCQFIYAEGHAEPWPPRPAQAIYHNVDLVIDGWKYWAMEPFADADSSDRKTVVNRSREREEP